MRPEGIRIRDWWQYNLLLTAEHFLGYTGVERYFGKRRQRLFRRIDRQIGRGGRINESPIPERRPEDMTAGRITSAELLRSPILFRGAAADWPCTQKWSLEFFEEQFGDLEVHLVDTVGAVDPDNPQEFETITLRQYLQQLKEGSRKYLKFSNLVQEKMQLRADMNEDWLSKFVQPGSIGKRFYFFIGGAGTVTPLHNEFPPVVYVQVTGRKRWILYNSNERIFFDPRAERRHYFYSNAHPVRNDDEAFPLMQHATRYEVVLEPGDVLWFPPFAWHYVENLDNSIGVAYKFSHIPSAWRTSKMLTSLYFLATRPNVLLNFFQHRFTKNTVDTRSARPKKGT